MLSVDYSILDAVDTLRYACGRQMTFGAHERSSMIVSTMDHSPPTPDVSSVLEAASVVEDRLDHGSTDELAFMQQAVADGSATSMFPSVEFP